MSLTKKVYGSAVYFLWSFMKSLKSTSVEWCDAISWSFFLLGILIMKKWVEFSRTSLGTLKHDCVLKTIEMFSFLPVISNSVTTGSSFLLIISVIISSKTMNILRFLPILYFSIFL